MDKLERHSVEHLTLPRPSSQSNTTYLICYLPPTYTLDPSLYPDLYQQINWGLFWAEFHPAADKPWARVKTSLMGGDSSPCHFSVWNSKFILASDLAFFVGIWWESRAVSPGDRLRILDWLTLWLFKINHEINTPFFQVTHEDIYDHPECFYSNLRYKPPIPGVHERPAGATCKASTV